jgi:hypothetical protein
MVDGAQKIGTLWRIVKTMQVLISWLPGYFWNGQNLESTGAALCPTQHINPENGEVRYYVRPIFREGATVGLYVRKQGILDALERGEY